MASVITWCRVQTDILRSISNSLYVSPVYPYVCLQCALGCETFATNLTGERLLTYGDKTTTYYRHTVITMLSFLRFLPVWVLRCFFSWAASINLWWHRSHSGKDLPAVEKSGEICNHPKRRNTKHNCALCVFFFFTCVDSVVAF